jgi:predicted DNA-binding antitoxin AbrB/MazE fold protein
MIQVTEAIYTHGLLKPLDELGLLEAQRVRLIVTPVDETERADRSSALKRLLAGIESMEFFSSGRLPARDELHNRP